MSTVFKNLLRKPPTKTFVVLNDTVQSRVCIIPNKWLYYERGIFRFPRGVVKYPKKLVELVEANEPLMKNFTEYFIKTIFSETDDYNEADDVLIDRALYTCTDVDAKYIVHVKNDSAQKPKRKHGSETPHSTLKRKCETITSVSEKPAGKLKLNLNPYPANQRSKAIIQKVKTQVRSSLPVQKTGGMRDHDGKGSKTYDESIDYDDRRAGNNGRQDELDPLNDESNDSYPGLNESSSESAASVNDYQYILNESFNGVGGSKKSVGGDGRLAELPGKNALPAQQIQADFHRSDSEYRHSNTVMNNNHTRTCGCEIGELKEMISSAVLELKEMVSSAVVELKETEMVSPAVVELKEMVLSLSSKVDAHIGRSEQQHANVFAVTYEKTPRKPLSEFDQLMKELQLPIRNEIEFDAINASINKNDGDFETKLKEFFKKSAMKALAASEPEECVRLILATSFQGDKIANDFCPHGSNRSGKKSFLNTEFAVVLSKFLKEELSAEQEKYLAKAVNEGVRKFLKHKYDYSNTKAARNKKKREAGGDETTKGKSTEGDTVQNPSAQINEVQTPPAEIIVVQNPSVEINEVQTSPAEINVVQNPSVEIHEVQTPAAEINVVQNPSVEINEVPTPSEINEVQTPPTEICKSLPFTNGIPPLPKTQHDDTTSGITRHTHIRNLSLDEF